MRSDKKIQISLEEAEELVYELNRAIRETKSHGTPFIASIVPVKIEVCPGRPHTLDIPVTKSFWRF